MRIIPRNLGHLQLLFEVGVCRALVSSHPPQDRLIVVAVVDGNLLQGPDIAYQPVVPHGPVDRSEGPGTQLLDHPIPRNLLAQETRLGHR